MPTRMWAESPEENKSNCVVHHALAKHERKDVVIDMEVVENGQHGHCMCDKTTNIERTQLHKGNTHMGGGG